MNSALWIFLCLFASVGIAHCAGLLLAGRKRPRGLRRGYYLVPLYDNPAVLEEQLRYSLGQIGWQGNSGETALLVDMGLGEESLRILEGMRRQNPGMFCCKLEDLADTLASLEKYFSQPA